MKIWLFSMVILIHYKPLFCLININSVNSLKSRCRIRNLCTPPTSHKGVLKLSGLDFSTFESFQKPINDFFQLISPSTTAEVASGLGPLGSDLLAFLCATIVIVPLFNYLKASSVIGFLAAGVLMGPQGYSIAFIVT